MSLVFFNKLHCLGHNFLSFDLCAPYGKRAVLLCLLVRLNMLQYILQFKKHCFCNVADIFTKPSVKVELANFSQILFGTSSLYLYVGYIDEYMFLLFLLHVSYCCEVACTIKWVC